VSDENGAGRFTFHWQERDGPPVVAPTGKGFGRVVLEQVNPAPRIELKAASAMG
jgi:hypothetical protein